MSRRQAIDIAMEMRGTSGASSLLSVGPLPDGVKDLLRIVAEGEWRSPATEHAYRCHSPEDVRAASAAFLAAALFHRKADPYRVLAVTPDATAEDLRENKRLLLKWLHPDRNPSDGERSYLGSVLEAAEAIEEARSRPGQHTRADPPHISLAKRSKTSRRSRPDPVRQTAQLFLETIGRGGKILLMTAAVVVTCLLAWRYVMNEPIGVSIERYSRLAMGISPW